jgi:hypothetical protein
MSTGGVIEIRRRKDDGTIGNNGTNGKPQAWNFSVFSVFSVISVISPLSLGKSPISYSGTPNDFLRSEDEPLY